jgi:hypothetical protein
METMFDTAVVASLFVGCAVATYLQLERAWRWQWREVNDGSVAVLVGGGAYRSGGKVPRFRERAPADVRLAAFFALLVGQLFVPCALVAATGLFFALLGFGSVLAMLALLMIPSLAAAAKLYRAGLSLLHRDPRLAYFRARDAADWTLVVGGVVAALMTALAICTRSGSSHDTPRSWLVVIATAILAMLEAMLLRLVTRKWEDALFTASAHPTIDPRSSML